ncbi:hypothetical protein CHS0354_041359 [Potamilus streckersoni]|uniref:Uncharacterized protein n=1 Tax=Potamilus streckersoni TaxID=2493646 RepID=A0AAE0TAI3_9BIVA|nr:hypothetical protein CHS0354_041359 [Potamilus streckersoni]
MPNMNKVLQLYDNPEINVEVPLNYIGGLKAEPLSNEKKNEQILHLPNLIKEKCCRLGTSDRSEMFQINGCFNFEEEQKVMVKFHGDESSQYLDFCAVVKDTTWIEIPAEHKLLPVIKEKLEKLKIAFKDPIIEHMSLCLIMGNPDNTHLIKPVKVQLPFNPLASSGNSKTLMVRLNRDDQAVVSDTKPINNAAAAATAVLTMLISFSCSIVQTKQPVRDDKSSMNALRDEFLYMVGEAKRCTLLTFMNKPKSLIRTEIIEKEAKEKVKETMWKKGFQSLDEGSEVITLRKGQRIRVDLSGRIQRPQTRKYFGMFVVFQPYLDTKCMEFRFEINNQMGAALHGEIRYSSDNFDKRVLHTLHFDPFRPFADNCIYQPSQFSLYRSNTAPNLSWNTTRSHQAADVGGRGKSLTPRP